MKKTPLLNSKISRTIAEMGHTDKLTIADAGLPINQDVERIDLALKEGIPKFLETLDVVLSELVVEEVTLASETKESNQELYEEIVAILKKHNPEIKIKEVTHHSFKIESNKSKAVIRTGEYTPFSNIILKSGVVF
ncbi:D-ribose pyranase [Natranaerobius trueperi]|uniref:D-ribose pyranase n=1 Tax=Natranaerobius trueperi TaxID=759412 RepID=A0A226BY15_9FIRM|nr:D-ribose pyranase [Natranaerobius trueperi]OWZ83030.1 D-ribose pyranase [Natranaerobius trueperi]